MPDYLLRATNRIDLGDSAAMWPEIEGITGFRPIRAQEYRPHDQVWGSYFEYFFMVQTGDDPLGPEKVETLKDRGYLVAQLL
jgi:hypothetical protein